MKIVAILSLFAVIALAQANLYHIQAFLGDYNFETVKGTLKLYVHRNSYQKDLYRLNETSLVRGQVYTSQHNLPQNIQQIDTTSFYWTLSSPIPPKYVLRKPSIWLKGIRIIPTYIQNPEFRRMETRNFCPSSPASGIKHKQEIKLVRC